MSRIGCRRSSEKLPPAITIKGPIVSPGYYNRPEVNRETFRDGWLQTGDLGYLDDGGRLHVTGRAKEIIVTSSGKNIYPEEIEAHYAQSQYVKELCVMGRTVPGAPAAERLHAVVVPDFDVLREEKIFNAREMMSFDVSERLHKGFNDLPRYGEEGGPSHLVERIGAVTVEYVDDSWHTYRPLRIPGESPLISLARAVS